MKKLKKLNVKCRKAGARDIESSTSSWFDSNEQRRPTIPLISQMSPNLLGTIGQIWKDSYKHESLRSQLS